MKSKLLLYAAGSLLYSAVYLFAFWLVTELHAAFLVKPFPKYQAFLERNIPIFLCIVFGIAFLLFLLLSKLQTVLSKGKMPGILRTARFAPLSRDQMSQIAVMGVGAALLFLGAANISGVRSGTHDFDDYVHTFGTADSFAYVLIGVGFLGVVFEELLFRGIVFNALNARMPAWLSVPLASVIYGYFQPSFWIQITAFFLGILYGLVYLRMKSLWSTIGIGTVVNCLILIADRAGLYDAMADLPAWLPAATAAAGLLLIMGALAYLWKGAPAMKKYGVMLGNLAVYVGIYYGLLQILVAIWEQAVLPRYPELGNHGIIGLYTNAILAMPIYYFVLKGFYKKDLISIAQFRSVSGKSHVLNILLAVCMAFWVMSLFSIPEVKQAAPGFEGIVGFFLAQNAWVFFSFFVINSVYKEILFRALIFNELRRALPLWPAMLVTGVLYGILFFSGDLPLMLYGTAGAVIFGLIYVWYRSIWLTIVNEYVLFGSYYLIRHGGGLPAGAFLYAILGMSSIAILLLLFGLWRSSRPAGVALPESEGVGLGA